ncbi:MAG: ribosomal protein L13e [Nitrososphaerales archaeon]
MNGNSEEAERESIKNIEKRVVKKTNELMSLPPLPKVICKNSHSIKFRLGRGFSLLELKEAGLSIKDARRLNLRVDPRRKTAHKENIELIKNWLYSQSKVKNERVSESKNERMNS